MSLIERIIARACSNRQRIVLPESFEERTITAADRAIADGLADIILIGNREKILAYAASLGLTHIAEATIIDPATSEKTEEYAQLLFQLRQKKGMTLEKAREVVLNPLYFGCLIIKSGDADGQISGALSTTGETLRPALQIIKCAPGITCVSGAMLLITQTPQFGEDGVLVVGDVAVTRCRMPTRWPRSRSARRRRPRAWPDSRIPAWRCFPSPPRVLRAMRSWIRWSRQRRSRRR